MRGACRVRFILLYVSLLIVSGGTEAFAQEFIEQTGIQLVWIEQGTAAWGDYDNDGSLDLFIAGYTETSFVATIYRNNGNGTFTAQSGIVLPGVYGASAAWGDYDNDGYLDLLLSGYDGNDCISKLFRNNGNNTFSEQTGIGLHGVYAGSVAWGDFDNDGFLDILLAGADLISQVSMVYKNNGDNTFTEQTAISLEAVQNSSVAWGDFDNDGYLDILLTGTDTLWAPVSKVYRNNGDGTFADETLIVLTGVDQGSSAWGDYNDDGYLDILLTGHDIADNPVSKIYRNNKDGTFAEMTTISLAAVEYSSVCWGDYDNDGFLDILLSGYDGAGRVTKIYKNVGDSTFAEQSSILLAGVEMASVAWGDYNNDGRLDIALTGLSGSGPASKIYRNNGDSVNTPPGPPSGLSASVAGSRVTLSWNKSTDTRTPQNGLSYNLRIGTGAGGIGKKSPMADATTGYRRVASMGNTNHRNSWTWDGLAPGTTYSYSVQAIDNALAGSIFSSEGYFGVYTLAVSATNGTVTRDPDQATYQHWTSVQLTPNPIANYRFKSWSGDTAATANPLTVVMTRNRTITANFELNSYTLSVAAVNGSVTKNPDQPTYTYGTNVELSASASEGYHFTGWSGDTVSPANPLTVVMHSNVDVTANFSVNLPEFSAVPKMLDLGTVIAGLTKTDSVLVGNTGLAPLAISSVISDNTHFAVNPGSALIPAPGSLRFSVTFSPMTSGADSARIIFTHNAPTAHDTVTVYGRGLYSTVAVAHQARWNMISNPVIKEPDSLRELFPATVFPYAFSYDSSYRMEHRLRRAAGYWAKFTSDGLDTLEGGLHITDSVGVRAGWNLIGSPSFRLAARAVTAIGTRVQTGFFTYGSGGYRTSDTLSPGRAYWVRVSTPGALVLGSLAPPVGTTAPRGDILSSLSILTVTDARGMSGELYFGLDTMVGKETDPARYELPPPPPSGAFDVRFPDDRMAELAHSRSGKQLPLVLSSADYPLALSWDMRGNSHPASVSIGGRTVPLIGKGALSIAAPGKDVILKFSYEPPFPRAFGLAQNYPNPFNPATVIRYDLPEPSHVKLTVYNVLGEEITTLVKGVEPAGSRAAEFDGRDLSSGVYFYRISAVPVSGGGAIFTETRRMILLR